jgi:long-chain acyl-CoA synthetase
MNIASLLHSVARRLHDRPAVSGDNVTFAYGEWIDRVGRLAGAMRAAGATPGDRVILWMENCVEFLELLAAAWTAGLVTVPVNAKLHEREVAYIVKNSAPKLLFCTPGFIKDEKSFAADRGDLVIISVRTDAYRSLLKSAPSKPIERASTDPAWIFYTSGTTGRPKGAILTHRNLLFMAQTYYADIDEVDERDNKIHAAPMSHGSGLYGIPHLLKGGHQIIHKGFDVGAVLEALDRYDRVTFFCAPTMLVRLINDPQITAARLDNLKTIYYGGGPTYVADLKRAVDIFGARLFQLYGQGETPMTATGLKKSMHANPGWLATCGIARSGVEVRVVDDNDIDLPTGAMGEIVTRSDCVMQGYLGDPNATAAALRGGWLHTGDIGSLDDRGFLTIHDRSKDVIISGGTNIYPREVEEVLLRHSAVLEVSVVGRPHPEWGEDVVAFVACRDGHEVTQNQLDSLCLDQIARFKRPKEYRFVSALPKSDNGKILKSELRKLLQQESKDA